MFDTLSFSLFSNVEPRGDVCKHVRGVPLGLLYMMSHCIEVCDDVSSFYRLGFSSVPDELDEELVKKNSNRHEAF